MNDAPGVQIELFLRSLGSPGGVLAIVVGVALILSCLLFPRVRWWALAGLLFVATIPVSDEGTITTTLAAPLDVIKREGRGLTGGLIVILFLTGLGASRGWRKRLVLPAAWSFFLFEVVYSCRVWFGGHPERGFTSLILFLVIFLAFHLGVSRWLRSAASARRFVLAMGSAATLYGIANIYQFLREPDYATVAHRFFGISTNPQLCAVNLVVLFLPCLALIVHKNTSKFAKTWFSAVFGLLAVLLIWTASRTGAVMGIVAVLSMLRLSWRRTLGLTVVGVIAIVVFWYGLGWQGADPSRLLNAQNTRSGIAADLWDTFVQSPVAGSMHEGLVIRENSYLSVLSVTGLAGGVPFYVAVLLIFWAIFRLQRARKYLGDDKVFADLVVASFVTSLVGGLGEGVVFGLMTAYILMLYANFALTAYLLDAARAEKDSVGGELPSYSNYDLVHGEMLYTPSA